jgi:Mrp family chromosome partitioning ATPase
MIGENEVLNALKGVIDPEIGKNIVDLGMVRDLVIHSSGLVTFTLALTVPACPLRDQMAAKARQVLLALPGIENVEVTFGMMTEEERRAVIDQARPNLPRLNAFNKIKQVIAVMSGKGGVGKSSLTALLAVELARRGQKCGILDADITGPSIPRLFGLPPGGLRGNAQGILPAVTSTGIKVVSTNLLVPEEDTAVIWRGPMIAGTIQQFWTDVLWGKLDVLLIDLPPGTADAALTVVQSLPLNGVILVTSPQQLAALVVRKAVNMLRQLEIPILGVVENFSYYPCPESGVKHAVFGPSHVEEIAESAGINVLARLPIDPAVTEFGDCGQIEDVKMPEIGDMVGCIFASEPSNNM